MNMPMTAAVFVVGILCPGIALAEGNAVAGEALYEKVCKMCHEEGMMGAPRTGDKDMWAPLAGKGETELTRRAIEGFNMMPPRGSCKSCSDEEIADAVAYMLSKLR